MNNSESRSKAIKILTQTTPFCEIKPGNDLYFVSFRDFIEMSKNGTIVSNPMNRGGEPFDREHINEIKDEFETKHFSEMKVGKFAKELMTCDGNYRRESILELDIEGWFDSKEKLDTLIPLYVLTEEEFHREYMQSHQTKALTSRQKVTDPNLHIGYYVRDLVEDKRVCGKIKRKNFNTLAYIVTGCESLKFDQWSYANFVDCRSTFFKKYVNKAKGELNFSLSLHNKEKIIEGIQWWKGFMDEIDKAEKESEYISQETLHKARCSSGLFGLVVADRMLPKEYRRVTSCGSPKILARQYFRNAQKAISEINSLSNGSRDTIEKHVNNLANILKK